MHAGVVLPRAAPTDMRNAAGWLRRKAAAAKHDEEAGPLQGRVKQGVKIRVCIRLRRNAAADDTAVSLQGGPLQGIWKITPICLHQQLLH